MKSKTLSLLNNFFTSASVVDTEFCIQYNEIKNTVAFETDVDNRQDYFFVECQPVDAHTINTLPIHSKTNSHADTPTYNVV